MSGETGKALSGWTVDTLKEFVQTELNDLRATLDERAANGTKAVDAALVAADKLVQQALASAEKAVTKAENAQEKRLEGVNEFRAQLTDQASTFIRREEVDQRIKSLDEKQRAVEGRAGERLTAIEKRLDLSQGNEQGARTQVSDTRDSTRFGLGFLAILVIALQIYNAFKR